jgi:hypothetical protein
MLLPAAFTKSNSKTKLIGSYGRVVPNSLGPGGPAEGWPAAMTTSEKFAVYRKKDIDKTIDALIATGQTMYGVGCGDGTAWDNSSGENWVELIELLEKTAGTDIKIFAMAGERHHGTAGTENRWGVVKGSIGGPADEFGLREGGDPLTRASQDAEAAAGWAIAAEELSLLSVTHPHLIGFGIDDFGPVNDPLYAGYTRGQIESITLAAKIHNSDFKFWPTQYFQMILKQIIPSTVIGVTLGQPMLAGEYVATEYSFNVSETPSSARLTFMFNDGNKNPDADDVEKNIYVNEHLIYNSNTAGFSWIETIDQDIKDHLDVGSNILRVEIAAINNASRWADKLLYIEPPLLVLDEINIVQMTQSFDRQETYFGDSGSSGGSPFDGKVITNLPTSDYFSDYVDGFFSVFTNKTAFDGTSEALIKKYKSAIGKKEMHYIEQSFLLDLNIESASTISKFENASSVATSTMAWNWPIDLYDLNAGVFSQKTPATLPNLPMLANWPERQTTVAGWYSSWTTTNTYSGEIEVKIKDSHYVTYYEERAWHSDFGEIISGPVEFLKRIYTSDGTELYNDETTGDEGDGAPPASTYTAETKIFNLGITPVTVSFEVSLITGIGNVTGNFEFGMKSGGAHLVPTDFTFSSGTDDAYLNSAYQDSVEYFGRPSWER